MSIRIRFSLEPKRKIFLGINWNCQSAEGMVKKLAKELGYRCVKLEKFWLVRICPEGHIWIRWCDRSLQGECQTNIAGPGFHVAAIDFLEKLARKEKLNLEVQDKTGYFLKRDFLSMRQKFFYQWFSDVIELVSRWGEEDQPLFCFPTAYYIPERQKERLVTHIRSLSLKELRSIVHSGLSVAFARDFFVWNEIEKDEYYYRNSGIVSMNQMCYYMPSARSEEDKEINQSIIIKLEKALSMNPNIPFPVKGYLEICRLDGHEPVDLTNVTPMEGEEGIGCRKYMTYRKVGNMSYAIPGNFLYGGEKGRLMDYYYDGKEYGGHEYFVYIAALEGREAEFKNRWFELGIVEKLVDFSIGKAQAKAAFYEPEEKDGELLYKMSAQVIYQEQRMNIIIVCRKPDEQEWALGLIKSIKIAEQSG